MSVSVWGSVQFNSVGRKLQRIIDAYPGAKGHLYITSSHRPHTPGSHHGGRLSHGGSPTSAIDIGFGYPSGNRSGGVDLARWLLGFQSNTVELIHSASPGFFVKNGSRVGPYAQAAHWDHVHFACSSAQADRILANLGAGGGGGGGGSGGMTSERSIESQQRAVNNAGHSPSLAVDGIYGPKTKAGVEWLQGRLGVTQDGLWGPQTESAYNSGGSSGGGSSSGGPGLDVDGIFGPLTTRALQNALNGRLG